jgi:PAS domain S-box-containing protein
MKNMTIDILLIEDNLSEADLIKEMLSEVRSHQYSVEHVQNLTEGLDLLHCRSFNAILFDLGIQDSHGLETLAMIQNQKKHTPIIVLSVLDDEDLAIKSLEMESQDYLTKSEIDSSILNRSILYAIQRKRAVEELRKSEMKFATIFQAAPVMLVITKLIGGEIIDVNDTFLKIFGYQRKEMVGRTTQELCIWEYLTDRDEVVQALLEQGPFRDLEINYRDKSGQLVIALMSAELIEIEGEQYMLSLMKDITEQKRKESEIILLNASLASRVSELEEMSAFNYMVSHDLRQPLTSISGACQVIKMLGGEKLDKESKGYLKMAIDGVDNMNKLIDTLLRLSRPAHHELLRKMVDIEKIVRVIVANLTLAEPGRQITFKIAEGLMAKGDPELLKVVLENLIGNAWKFTGEQRQAVIEIGSAEINGMKAFFVRDNGPGFRMVDAEKLFIPFKRLSETAEFTGHGIGLATVERIIRRHSGKVWAEGEPDKGATFYFRLG